MIVDPGSQYSHLSTITKLYVLQASNDQALRRLRGKYLTSTIVVFFYAPLRRTNDVHSVEDMEMTDNQPNPIIFPSCIRGNFSASSSFILCKTPLKIPQFLHSNNNPSHNPIGQGCFHSIFPRVKFNIGRYHKSL